MYLLIRNKIKETKYQYVFSLWINLQNKIRHYYKQK